MQVDWKVVCQCAGYKSLKAAYISDAAEARIHAKRFGGAMRDPKELYRCFQKALALVYRYSSAMGIPFEEALDRAESGRGYWWMNYYQSHQISNVLGFQYPSTTKPNGIRGYLKDLKKCGFSKADRLERLNRFKRKLRSP